MSFNRFFLAFFSCFLFATAYSAPFVADGSNYDIIYHRISISVDPTGGSKLISNGSVTTYFRTTAANVTTLQFDLDGAMTVSSAKYHGSTITKNHNTSSDILTLTVPTIGAVGTLDSVTVFYSGTPVLAPTSGVPSGYNFKLRSGGNYCIYTLGEAFTAHNWWPCKESLYDKIDSVDLIVTTPNTYKVGGNGLVTEVPSGSNTITTWKTRYPIATYGINFAVANYQNYQYSFVTGGKTLQVMNYFYAEDNTTTYRGYADQLKTIIPAFSTALGVDYPFLDEKYGLAECTAGWGALEVQSMTFMASDSYSDNGYTMAHEAAHQWFGDMVTTNSWHQVWLNEGFAQYFESVVYPEKLRPSDLATKRSSLKGGITSTSTVYVPDTTSANNIFIPASSIAQPYGKGAMLISMLRTWVGDAGFFNGLRDYLTAPFIKYDFGAVDSLKKYMQVYTPFDLTNFFNDWVNKQGYANYSIGWTNVGKRIIFKLQQTPTVGGAGYFDMPVPIRITGTGLDTTVTIIDRRGVLYNSATGSTTGTNTIAFNLSAIPTGVSYDPKNLVLGSGTFSINTTLPLLDIALQATRTNQQVNLSWKINMDEPVKELMLERSSDGTNFSSVKNYSSVQFVNSIAEGSFTDNLLYANQYYRLKIAMQDKEVKYSKVQVVNGNGYLKFEVVPNPVASELTVTLPESFYDNELTLIIRNVSGQVIRQLNAVRSNGGKLIIQANGFASGMYVATITNKKNESAETSFMKQ